MSAPQATASIRARLVALLLVGALILSMLAFVVVRSVARQVAQESQDIILQASAHSILDNARMEQGEIMIDIPYSALSMLDRETDERVFYAIWLGGEFLSGYQSLARAPVAEGRETGFASERFAGEQVRVATTRRAMSTSEGAAVLEVSTAQTLNGLNRRLDRISRISLGVGAGFFLLAALMALGTARSATAPMQRLAASVARRGPQDLRPVAAPVPSEMVPLVAALNRLMERLAASLSRSEDFIAEAAHRVRTPLAILRTQAEITLRRVEKPENRARLREMIRAIDESSRTAGQLLDHAMVSFRTDHLNEDAVDLGVMLEDMMQRLRPLSELKDISLRAALDGRAVIRGDPILLQNAVHNLLDNAIKYSPADSEVRLRLSGGAGRVTLSVCDQGAGFPEPDLQGLTERFARGGNASAIVGSGLGLTIAKEVVEAHGGTLTLSNQTGAGACVTLSFPAF